MCVCVRVFLLLLQVQNYVPSISGITGVSPQRYVWRICIALHSAPRLIVGFVYVNYYLSRLDIIAEGHKILFKRLVNINFWLYIFENAGLIGVTYIANVDNYRKYFHQHIIKLLDFSEYVIRNRCIKNLKLGLHTQCYYNSRQCDFGQIVIVYVSFYSSTREDICSIYDHSIIVRVPNNNFIPMVPQKPITRIREYFKPFRLIIV